MLSGLEIIEIIKEYINVCDERIESSKMWGLNNNQVIKFTDQKEILEKLLKDVDLRIMEDE